MPGMGLGSNASSRRVAWGVLSAYPSRSLGWQLGTVHPSQHLAEYLPFQLKPRLGLAQCLPLPQAKAVLEHRLWAGLPWSGTVALPAWPGPVNPCTDSTRASENICLRSGINKGIFGTKNVINVKWGEEEFNHSFLKLYCTFWLPSCDAVPVHLKKMQQGLGMSHSTAGCVTGLWKGRGGDALWRLYPGVSHWPYLISHGWMQWKRAEGLMETQANFYGGSYKITRSVRSSHRIVLYRIYFSIYQTGNHCRNSLYGIISHLFFLQGFLVKIVTAPRSRQTWPLCCPMQRKCEEPEATFYYPMEVEKDDLKHVPLG